MENGAVTVPKEPRGASTRLANETKELSPADPLSLRATRDLRLGRGSPKSGRRWVPALDA